MKEKIGGNLALFVATMIWGSSFVAQSIGAGILGPFTFQTFRCILAVIFLTALAYISGPKDFPNLFKNRKLWRSGMLCGLALCTASGLQQIGLATTDPGKAGFLTAMYIVLIPILGLFLGRKSPRILIICVGLAVSGLYLLCYNGSGTIRTGDLLLLLCAFFFAVQILLVDHGGQGVNGIHLNLVQCITTTVVSAIIALCTESTTPQAVLSCWIPLFYAGILSYGVAFTLQIVGQQRLNPTVASLIMCLESLFAALTGWLVLKQTMSPREMLGGLLIFSAVILSQLSDFKKNEKAPN